MKLIKASASIAAILVLLVASGPVNADRGYGHRGYHGHRSYHGYHSHGGHWRSGVRLGIVIGAPAYWYGAYPSYYYPYPPAYYPPVVTVPASPPVYVERGDTQAPPEVQNYWYYCPDEKAYYPYVKQCPGGWQRVVPQPPPS